MDEVGAKKLGQEIGLIIKGQELADAIRKDLEGPQAPDPEALGREIADLVKG